MALAAISKVLYGDAELAVAIEGSPKVPSILDSYSSVLERQPSKKKHQNPGRMLNPVKYEPRQRPVPSRITQVWQLRVPHCIALNGGTEY